MVITHVDYLTLAETEEFVDKVLEIVSKEYTVSNIEQDNFRYTGIDVSAKDDGIEIQMEDYVESLEDIKEILKEDRGDDLSPYQSKTGKKINNPKH